MILITTGIVQSIMFLQATLKKRPTMDAKLKSRPLITSLLLLHRSVIARDSYVQPLDLLPLSSFVCESFFVKNLCSMLTKSARQIVSLV